MVALLLQEPRVHRQSRPGRPDRATRRKQPDEGSMRFCSCLRSRMTLTRAPDERCGAEAFEDIDQHDLATVSGNDLVADHLLAGVIAALDQHTWLDLHNQIEGCVFFKDEDEITAPGAASTSEREHSSCTGRPSPFSRFTDASLFKPTIRRSQAPRAAVKTL